MVILLYHDIVKTGLKKGIYSVDLEEFKRQIYYLKENNYKILSLNEIFQILNSSKNIPNKSVALTFDDGLLNQFEFAYPVLKELGFSGCFFIIAGNVGKDGYMDWTKVKTLALNGMEIGSHGLTHKPFDLISKSEILNELKKSKEIIEKNLNREIIFLSIPRSCLKERVIRDLVIDVGYKVLCSNKIGYVESFSSSLSLNRFPIRRRDSLNDFIQILKKNPYKFSSYRINEFFKYYLKRSLGMRNYERLRRFLLKGEYLNVHPFPE